MIVLKLILCIYFWVILPILLGLIVTNFMKENKNLLFSFVIGYIIEFATFEILYLPMYFLNCSFKLLLYIWTSLMIGLSVVSVIINIKNFKDIASYNLQIIKSIPNLVIVWIILLSIQIYFPVNFMQQIDPDDAFYLATTNTTIETNSLFQYDGYTGEKGNAGGLRYAMSGLVIYYAVLSKVTLFHPAILQHTIWPAIAVILEFSLYALIGNKLFKGDKEKLVYFLIFLSTLYIFGWISIYTNFAFFAYRSWQGKALISNFIIPAVWLFYILCIENDKKLLYWLLFIALMISSIFVTELGVFLIPIEVGVLSLIYLIQNKKVGIFIKSLLCCVPQIIVGIVYLMFK